MLNRQMSEKLNSYDAMLLNEIRYKILCRLHQQYLLAIKTVVENVYSKSIANPKVYELDNILQEIETLPISWEFYKHQKVKFVPDFENLVVFTGNENI